MVKKEKDTATPVKCWLLKRGTPAWTQRSEILVCEGETAYEWGDPSVGIPNVEVTVKKLLVGKHGVSVLVQYKDQEPYEESISRYSFAEERLKEHINDLEMEVESARDNGKQALQELREEYKRKYGEDLQVGQRVIAKTPPYLALEKKWKWQGTTSERRGKIIDIDRDIHVTVKWDKHKTPDVKKPEELMDEKEWDEFEKKLSQYDDFAERLERERPFKGPFD